MKLTSNACLPVKQVNTRAPSDHISVENPYGPRATSSLNGKRGHGRHKAIVVSGLTVTDTLNVHMDADASY